MRRRPERLAYRLAALPAIAAIALLLYTMLSRLTYPYDLEWMEGGLLTHAQRLAERQGIYVAPSQEFIPYLYTPLYPALVAMVGGLAGIGYTVGRAISVLATLGTLALLAAAVLQGGRGERRASRIGGLLAAGLYAATYPWVDGWFDLVRADALFVLMIVGGLLGVRVWARHPGGAGIWRVAAMAYLLALAFFCKQTGVLFCALGGVMLLILNPRRAPLYLVVAAVFGLGGSWLFQRATGGWFWTYAYEVHQAHDFSRDRFLASFGNMLGHFPAMTAAIGLGLLATAAGALRQRRLPPGAAGLVYWSAAFVVALAVGALGWATQWAHFNAYMPAMALGALAAGAALPAIVGSLDLDDRRHPHGAAALDDLIEDPLPAFPATGKWPSEPLPRAAIRSRRRRALGLALASVVALGLAVDVARSLWKPGRFVPRASDLAAGDALITRLRAVDGPVFVPFHPWYAELAGKPGHVHRMGLLDVTYKGKLAVEGLREALAAQRWSLIVLDDRPIGPELAALTRSYRMDDVLPADERPRTYSGARVQPRSLWVPNVALELPPGARVLHDFEGVDLPGWTIDGTAWGRRPVRGPVGDQGQVYRYGGRSYLTSYHGGDAATGVLSSPEFTLDGSRITFRRSGGADAGLRIELLVDGVIAKTATGTGNERMDEIVWNVAALTGRRARLRLVDQAEGAWGHLNADEFWLWQ